MGEAGGPRRSVPGDGSAGPRSAFFAVVVLLVARARDDRASTIVTGNAPDPWITMAVAVAVVAGLALSARWLWRNTRDDRDR